jgi:putative restriction endonuclease
MDREQLLNLFSGITTWGRGDQRAPHKPLLILYALGRWQNGEVAVTFENVNTALSELLVAFAPPRKVIHTEAPFWRLQNDGIWEVETSSTPTIGADGSPSKKELLRLDATGHFRPEIQSAFKKDPGLVRALARQLLEAHFPTSLHDDICNAVGLDLLGERPTGGGRDPSFRRKVLLSYDYRCAVCGLQLLLSGTQIALEAAHIKWHQAGGPGEVRNGVCLCVMHHKLLDLGTFTVGSSGEVLVSDAVSGGFGFSEHLLAFHGKPLRTPTHPADAPFDGFTEWHRREVFHGRSRPL